MQIAPVLRALMQVQVDLLMRMFVRGVLVAEYARECRLARVVCQSLSYVLYKTSY